MVKQAPTPARLLTMVLFALSCFGLLLFLWISFGGSVPLQPKGYRIKVAFPEATQLGAEAEVRVAGVRIGKVREKTIDDEQPNRTIATLEIDPKYAPIRSDARAILRQKTLLGETYVEMTLGSKAAPPIREDGQLSDSRVAPTVELDEIFQALDPSTRAAFQRWQKDLAVSTKGAGETFNDALGTLPTFVDDGDRLLTVLDAHGEALSRLIRNTGVVFGAITQREDQLQSLVTNAGTVFETTARREQDLAEVFRIFPTFLDESKATFRRLDAFARTTDPLIRDLRPVAQDLRPTLRDVRALAPDLESFFRRLDPLITASHVGLPALRRYLDGLGPVLDQVQPFLEQINPILQWLEYNQRTVADFFANGAGALADSVPTTATPQERGHYLRQFGPAGMETAAIYNNRTQTPTARGNAYLNPATLSGAERAQKMIFPNWDCKSTRSGGPETTGTPNTTNDPSCFVQAPPMTPLANGFRFPHIEAANYSAGTSAK